MGAASSHPTTAATTIDDNASGRSRKSNGKNSTTTTTTTMAANLTIRNLTITPLELRQAERIAGNFPEGHPKPANGFAKLTSKITGRRGTPSATAIAQRQATAAAAGIVIDRKDPSTKELADGTRILIQPFSENTTTIRPPDLDKGEQLKLTFSEHAADGSPRPLYVATIPAISSRSIVMRSVEDRGGEGGKEFTLIYIPTSSYLAIFSSSHLHAWMAELHNDYPLSALSIPGTHNSPTCYVALPSVRCQAVSVREQLDNGVRFLDVRVSCPSPPSSPGSSSPSSNYSGTASPPREQGIVPNLALVHSAFPISLSGTKYFHDLLSECYSFLAANPTETLLMSVKREGTGKGTDQDLSRYLVQRYLQPAEKWFTEPRVPSLGEVRGKIVLVRRFHVDPSLGNSGLGIDGSVWPDNCADGTCGSGMIRIQVYYEVGQTADIEKKRGFVQEQLARAAQQAFALPPPNPAQGNPVGPEQTMTLPMFINFLTGSNFFNASCWPEKIAAKLNPSAIEYLCMHHGAPGKGPGGLSIGDAATGVVVTDWVGAHGDWDLLRCIVGWNARLQLKI